MSKSSKAKKRLIKMIRAEGSILGEENLCYEEFNKNWKQYYKDRIEDFGGVMTNKQMLKYYKTNVLPKLIMEYIYKASISIMANDIQKNVKSGNISKEDVTKAFDLINENV